MALLLDRIDNFDRPNATGSGSTSINLVAPFVYTALTYAGTANTAEISSNTVHETDVAYADNAYRVGTPCTFVDHGASIIASSVTTSGSTDVGLHVMCRMDTSDATPTFYMFTNSKLTGQVILKCVAGAFTALSTVNTATPATNDTLQGDCVGSTLTHTFNGTSNSITDTAITGGLRCGFLFFRQTNAVNIFGNDFRYGPALGSPFRPRSPNLRAPQGLRNRHSPFSVRGDQSTTVAAVSTPLAVAGSMTATGALVKSVTKPLAGSSTATGSLVKSVTKPFAGSSTATGSLVKSVTKRFAGTSTATGSLVKSVTKALAGSSTATGALVKSVTKAFAGSVTPTGALTKSVTKPFAGSSTPTGSLVKSVTKAVVGSCTPSGSLVKSVGKSVSGSSTPTGSLAKSVTVAFAGSVTPSGALSKLVTKAYAGVLTAAGDLVTALLGTVTPDPTPYLTYHQIDGRRGYELDGTRARSLDGHSDHELEGRRVVVLNGRRSYRRKT